MEIELKKMLLVNIEGNLIENIIIQDNLLLFSDTDSNEDVIYKTVPVNEYEEGTDSYYKVLEVLEMLELNSEEGRKNFKNCCLLMYTEGNNSFRFEDFSIDLEAIPEDKTITIIK